MRLLSRSRCIWLGVLVTLGLTLVAVRYWPRAPLAQQIATSTAVFDRQERLLRLTLAGDQQYRLWTDLENISPEFVAALLLHEDQHFYRHPGVDPLAILRASWATLTRSSHQGGSTISMQLARLLYQLNTRSVGGKLVQMARALQLELCYSKHDLLEAHLNLLPYGGNVQGIGAASLIYFGKAPQQLSLPEALALVLIPQAPAQRTPAGDEPQALIAARQRLFARWQSAHAGAHEDAQNMAQPLHFNTPKQLPFAAPHFVQHVLATHDPRVQTTLDLAQQRLLERLLKQYVRDQSNNGVHNASALLVDSRDLSVRAMVGSADFFNANISGQVNGTLAKRSPGSALKPFVYALAMDQGLIHPLTVLKDAPTNFGAFSPENFDSRFIGPINATQALIRSRNVPAVILASQLSNPSLHQFLQSAGISQLQSAQHYGLSLALGGGEVTMEELSTMYTLLVNRGSLKPLRYLQTTPRDPGTRLLSEEASFMVLDMLKQNPRPDDTPTSTRAPVRVAWKTGTSWGFRDAWTAGVFGPYVLVVWVGNFDGSSNPNFIGVQTAAPLFFRLFDALLTREPALSEPSYRLPARLQQVQVCTASGDLPNADCPQTTTTWYIPGVSPIKLSSIHRRLMVDTRTGQIACPPYDRRHSRAEVFEFWPSDLAQLFAKAGMPRRQPPQNTCVTHSNETADSAPLITSPLTNTVYSLRRHDVQAIPFTATLAADSRQVFWFVDSSYVGHSAPNIAMAWTPEHAGAYSVLAVDDQGRTTSRELNVEWVQ